MGPTARKPRTRTLRTALAIVLLAVLLMIMLLLILDSLGASALSNAVKQARVLGGPLTLDELLATSPALPDEKNGANVILAIKPQLEAVKGEGIPILDNNLQLQTGRRWSAAEGKRVGELLESLQAELAAIDTLQSYAAGRFPVTLAEDPYLTVLPNLGPLRTSAHLKHLQIVYRAMQGDNSRLGDDLDILLRHPRLLADDPFLISALVARSCEMHALRALEAAISLAAVESEQLQRIEGLLRPNDVFQEMIRSVRGERAGFITFADYFRRTGSLVGSGGPDFARAVRIPGAQGWIMKGEAEGIGYFNRLLRAVSPEEMVKEAKTAERELIGGSSMILTRSMLPSLSRGLVVQLERAAEMNCARVALAAERHRLDTGAWPAQLEDLVPRYIAEIPEDPFAGGGPLRFIQSGQSFIIYSVGSDGRDDNGRMLRDQNQSRSPDVGFILMDPAARNLPSTAEDKVPASAPAA